jgi:CRP-like cAMP-binding protein
VKKALFGLAKSEDQAASIVDEHKVAGFSRLRSLRGLKNISWLTPRQLAKLAAALTVTRFDKRAIIFDESKTPEAAYVLLSGIARITCRNRKGLRTMVIMVAPGMIPGFPIAVTGVNCNFRCEAVTNCQVGTVELNTFIEISLGIASADFKRMAANYVGRWDLVHLRCSNFMSCTLAERLAITLLELSENFGTPDRRGVRLTVPARHRDLAELVGASRPRVTEHLIAFELGHMIARKDGRMVVKRERLERFLAGAHPAGLLTPRVKQAA